MSAHMPTELIAFYPEDEFNEPTDERLVVKRGQDCVILSAQEIVELVEFVCESNRLRDVAALLPPDFAEPIGELDAIRQIRNLHKAAPGKWMPEEVLAGVSFRLETDDPQGPSDEKIIDALEYALRALGLLPEPPKTRAQVEDELAEEEYAWQ